MKKETPVLKEKLRFSTTMFPTGQEVGDSFNRHHQSLGAYVSVSDVPNTRQGDNTTGVKAFPSILRLLPSFHQPIASQFTGKRAAVPETNRLPNINMISGMMNCPKSKTLPLFKGGRGKELETKKR